MFKGNYLFAYIFVIVLFLAGCGDFGGLGSGSGSTTINPPSNSQPQNQSVPDNQGETPGSNTAQNVASDQPVNNNNIFGLKGYVYKLEWYKEIDNFIVLPTNNKIPEGFIPAEGVVVRLLSDPPQIKLTDSQGAFNFEDSVDSNLSGDIENPDVMLQISGEKKLVFHYPVFSEPKPAYQLEKLRIVPPFYDDPTKISLRAGECELFYVIGKSGDKWHPVSDKIIWTVDNEKAGAFLDEGLFLSSDKIETTENCKITAQIDDNSLSLDVAVLSPENFSTISGRVYYGEEMPLSSVIIEAEMSDTENYCYRAILTDAEGKYEINNLPPGKYDIRVKDLYGNLLEKKKVNLKADGVEPVEIEVNSALLLPLVTAIVEPDAYQYEPGKNINVQVKILNLTDQNFSIDYDSIEVNMIETAIETENKNIITSSSASDINYDLPPFKEIEAFPSPLVLSMEGKSDTEGFYSIEAKVYEIGFKEANIKTFPAEVILVSLNNGDPNNPANGNTDNPPAPDSSNPPAPDAGNPPAPDSSNTPAPDTGNSTTPDTSSDSTE